MNLDYEACYDVWLDIWHLQFIYVRSCTLEILFITLFIMDIFVDE